MLIDLPVVYNARVIRPKKRTTELLTVRARVPVDIQDLSGDEAPLVLTRKVVDPKAMSLADRFEVEYRFFDGRLFKSVHHAVEPEGRQQVITVDLFRQYAAECSKSTWFKGIWPASDRLEVALEEIDPKSVRAIVETDLEEQTVAAQKAASETLFIDGKVFLPAEELILDAEWIGLGMTTLAVTPRVLDDARNRKSEHIWRADRLEDLITYFGEMRGEPFSDAEKARIAFSAGINVVRPDLLNYDDELTKFVHAMDRLITGFEYHLKSGPKEFLVAYADLRDSCKALKTGAERDMSTALAAAETAIDVWRSTEVPLNTALDGMEKAIRNFRRYRGEELDEAALSGFGPGGF